MSKKMIPNDEKLIELYEKEKKRLRKRVILPPKMLILQAQVR